MRPEDAAQMRKRVTQRVARLFLRFLAPEGVHQCVAGERRPGECQNDQKGQLAPTLAELVFHALGVDEGESTQGQEMKARHGEP